MSRIPLLVIAGPTAVGKTRIAVEVAERAGGEIVNADSMQVYRRLDVGTGKPTAEERRRVRFHLVDVAEPDEPYTVADFQRQARAALGAIADRGNLPILSGGTGLYLRAVLGGLRFPPRPEGGGVRGRLEEELSATGAAAMHARLETLDPAAAARIHVHDEKRIVRALEVCEVTGRPMSEQQAVDGEEAFPYNAAQFVIDRPRSVLYEAIERRVDEMLRAGWVEEVRRLLARGYGPDLQSMQALGYGWLTRHVRGELDLGEATRLIRRDTRRFAKRQLTWFRHQPGFTWVSWSGEAEIPQVVGRIVEAAEGLGAAGAGGRATDCACP